VSAADDDKSTRCQQLVGGQSLILLHVQYTNIFITFVFKSRYNSLYVKGTCYEQFYDMLLGAKSGNISNV